MAAGQAPLSAGSTAPSTGAAAPSTGTTVPSTGSTAPGTGSTAPSRGPHPSGSGATPPAPSRAELIERFLELQPRMRRWFTRATPDDLHAQMGAITVQQMHTLHAIARRGGVTMGELAGCLDAASLSSATQMSDRLVKLGLVERLSDPADRRLVRVVMSQRGRDLLHRREAAWREGVGRLLEALTDEECATLVRLLERAAGPPPTDETTTWEPSQRP
jgi:DNA-binding MarR family transcriptional regulator